MNERKLKLLEAACNAVNTPISGKAGRCEKCWLHIPRKADYDLDCFVVPYVIYNSMISAEKIHPDFTKQYEALSVTERLNILNAVVFNSHCTPVIMGKI